MTDRSRTETGDYDSEYSTDDILAIVEANAPIGTGSVAEKIGCHRNTARYRLKKLEDQGEVERVEVGTDDRSSFAWRR